MKFFNTAGPVNPKDHYCLPNRLNEAEVRSLIEQKKYFVLHAPRQTGKTTAIMEFVKKLNSEEKYSALYVNVEVGQAARSDFTKGLAIILDTIHQEIERQLGRDCKALNFFKTSENINIVSGNELKRFLEYWAQNSEKPLTLFIDEIDSLVGDTLISVLRQLRAGYPNRPEAFPQSVCLFGVRDVRDYRIWSDKEKSMVLGGSAFNIKAESLTLKDFSKEEVQALYLQHTQETRQKFTDEAIEYAFEQTQGQPWLVNALAYQACFRDVQDRSQTITKEILERAKEALIKRRDTHIDVLIDRLQEPRVRAIIDNIFIGSNQPTNFPIDDISYVLDLGLVKKINNNLAIANPIYKEVFPRELTCSTQQSLTQQTAWFQNSDGSMNTQKILDAFTQFYRENSAIWLEKFAYKESGPHLLMMAFLQRIINGGGKIHREYALGRGRLDLLVEWQNQRIVIELKVKRGQKYYTDGVAQTFEYMDTVNATAGHLIIFDRDDNKNWDEKVFHKVESLGSKKIDVWGM